MATEESPVGAVVTDADADEFSEEEADEAEEIDPLILALKKERLAKGLTQWQVAKKMRLASSTYLSRIEGGHNDIQLSTLRTWAESLGMDITVRATKQVGRPKNNFR